MMSLLSRSAALRGLATREMTSELGLGRKKLLCHAEEALARVRDLMGLGKPGGRNFFLGRLSRPRARGCAFEGRRSSLVRSRTRRYGVCPRGPSQDMERAVDHPADAAARLAARDFDRRTAELQLRIAIFGRSTALGIPVTEPVG
jgi:hypothetical protein